MKVTLKISLIPAGYAYMAGQTIEIGSDLGNELVKNDDAILITKENSAGINANTPDPEPYKKWKAYMIKTKNLKSDGTWMNENLKVS